MKETPPQSDEILPKRPFLLEGTRMETKTGAGGEDLDQHLGTLENQTVQYIGKGISLEGREGGCFQ